MYQREIYRCHRYTRTIDQFVYKDVITGEQRLFERRRRYRIVLTHKVKHEPYQYQGIDDCIDPRHDRSHRAALALAPPVERYVMCDIYVIEQKPHQQQPPCTCPDGETEPQGGNDSKPYPSCAFGLCRPGFDRFNKSVPCRFDARHQRFALTGRGGVGLVVCHIFINVCCRDRKVINFGVTIQN